jgi:hypothetical protein
VNARRLVRGAAGLAFLMAIGVTLTLVPTASASPISQGTALHPGPVNLPSSVHLIVPNATCTVAIALVAFPSTTVHLGQHFALQTQVFFHKSAPAAVCATPVGFVYMNAPTGCLTAFSVPTISCTAKAPGVFLTTVHVFFPRMTMGAATTVAVIAP